VLASVVGALGILAHTKVVRAGASNSAQMARAGDTPCGCNRIVSLSPSITEILFELGLGDKVVGVTRYCDYPPEARQKSQVGGYIDPNYELIMELRPDLVILSIEHRDQSEALEQLGLTTQMVDYRTISGILTTIETIGATCNRAKESQSLAQNIRTRMHRIEEKTAGVHRPRVLVSVGRNMGSGSLKDIHISGTFGLYDEMIALAGGKNAYNGRDILFPVLSGEGVLTLNPDVIIDMIPDMEEEGWDEEMVLREWESVARVEAVKNRRVHIFKQDYVVVPGPRFILMLEEMAKVLHPEVKW